MEQMMPALKTDVLSVLHSAYSRLKLATISQRISQIELSIKILLDIFCQN